MMELGNWASGEGQAMQLVHRPWAGGTPGALQCREEAAVARGAWAGKVQKTRDEDRVGAGESRWCDLGSHCKATRVCPEWKGAMAGL